MFRCKECGAEFDVKPDYCDCGNDTFDEIVEKVEVSKEEPVSKQVETKNPFSFEQKIEKVEPEKVLPKKDKKQEPLIVFERPDLPQIKIEPISLIIFLICLILSAVIILFVGNPSPDEVSKIEVEQQVLNKNIPNIDKFWDNTKPTAVEVETPIKNEVEEVNDVEQKPVEVVKPVQKVEKIQTQKAQSKRTNNAVTLPMPSGQKPVNVGQSKTQTQVKPKQTTTPKQVSSQKTQSNVVQKSNPQEMTYYKIALRNKIASKIDFTNILGDGTCVVSFKVSSSGQLINRAFAKQSDNGMLNDEVYQAIMSTPTFKAPPSGYNGATMRLTVKMYGGQFEVSLN